MRFGRAFPCSGKQHGVALVAVMWMIAALSLVIMGLVHSVRGEIHITSGARDGVEAAALGDAAIAMALQRLVADRTPLQGVTRMDAVFETRPISVWVAPLNGYIDIRRAPQTLLVDLFTVAGELPRGQAERLAADFVVARGDSATHIEAIEDLLPLLGGDVELYARLAPLITVNSGSGQVNPLAAPVGVLVVLARGDQALAARIDAAREADGALADTTSLPQENIGRGTVSQYRLEAHVPLVDGGTLIRVRVVDLGGAAEDGTPWRVLDARNMARPAARQID